MSQGFVVWEILATVVARHSTARNRIPGPIPPGGGYITPVEVYLGTPEQNPVKGWWAGDLKRHHITTSQTIQNTPAIDPRI